MDGETSKKKLTLKKSTLMKLKTGIKAGIVRGTVKESTVYSCAVTKCVLRSTCYGCAIA